MKFLPPILALTLLASCATNQERAAQLEVGMTRRQVTGLLGEPLRIRHQGAFTVLEFALPQDQTALTDSGQPIRSNYYVIVGTDDRVRSFGYD